MNNVQISFFEQEYTIPADLKKYLDILQLSGLMNEKLMTDCLYLLEKGDYTISAESFFPNLRECAETFVRLLCDNNIFSRTVEDYMLDNSGYNNFIQANHHAFETRKKIYSDAKSKLQFDVDKAYNNAASSAEQTGYFVYSNDGLAFAAIAAYQYFSLKKQHKQAIKQYRKDVKSAKEDMCSESQQRIDQYVSEVYIPKLQNSITQYVYEMLDRFISDMIANGKIDPEILNFINVGRSESLLKNCSLTPNKREVLKSAFSICPFNIDIYITAIEYYLFDEELRKCAEYFGCDNDLQEYINLHLSDISDADLPNQVKARECYFVGEAVLKGVWIEDIYQNRLRGKYEEFISKYVQLRNMINDKALCMRYFLQRGDTYINSLSDDAIKKLAQIKTKIADAEKDANFFINVCGFCDLWSRITLEGSCANSIEAVENEYAEKLYETYSNCILECKEISARNIERSRQAEIDKKIKEQKRDMQNIILTFAFIALLVIPFIAIKIAHNRNMEPVKEQISQLLTRNITRELSDPASQFNKEGLTDKFKIISIYLYKSDREIDMLVPTILFYSNKSHLDINNGFRAVSSVGSEFSYWYLKENLNIPGAISDSCGMYFNSLIQDRNGVKDQYRCFSKDYRDHEDYYIYDAHVTGKIIGFYLIYAVISCILYKKLKAHNNKKFFLSTATKP